MNWEDFKELLGEDDQLIDEDRAELFDTGSVTIEMGDRKFEVVLTVKEVS